MNSLTIKNLSKTRKQKKVVEDVNMQLFPNEVVGLLGPNGAGKTTTFYMIAGLIRPDCGQVVLNGEDISNLSIYDRAKNGLIYLPQEVSIFNDMSVSDNIMAVLEMSEKNPIRRQEQLKELMDEFGITHIKNLMGSVLSGGEKRRVEIARALAAKPKYILLDEPFAGVDPIAILDIKKLIIRLKKFNIGILITDHNVKDALSLIDRSYIVYGGKILLEGDVNTIVNDVRVKQLYLGENFTW
jgi:lipopolysaccharide export system ATP-binding protein